MTTREEVKRLKEINAELLEALKDLVFESTGLVADAYIRDAQAVIAKAEGAK